MEITISGEDKERLQQVEELAKRLGLQVKNPLKKEKLEKKNRSKKLYELMEKAAAEGDLFHSIKDPVAWQREQRTDRILPGREE